MASLVSPISKTRSYFTGDHGDGFVWYPCLLVYQMEPSPWSRRFNSKTHSVPSGSRPNPVTSPFLPYTCTFTAITTDSSDPASIIAT